MNKSIITLALAGTILILSLAYISSWDIQPMGPVGEYICDDGIDNDGDTLTDCEDPNCHGSPGPDGVCEYYTEFTCNDSSDNDGDGLTDCDDPDCLSRLRAYPEGYCSGSNVDACYDEIDNDFDSKVDCDDPNCHGQEGPGGLDCIYPNTAPVLSGINLNDTSFNQGDEIQVSATGVVDPDTVYDQPLRLICSTHDGTTIHNYDFCLSGLFSTNCAVNASESPGEKIVYCRLYDEMDYSNEVSATYTISMPQDLYIEWIKPIQVVEDVPLVTGKATVVRVKVVNDGPEVTTALAVNVGNGCWTDSKQITIGANTSNIFDFYPSNNCIQ